MAKVDVIGFSLTNQAELVLVWLQDNVLQLTLVELPPLAELNLARDNVWTLCGSLLKSLPFDLGEENTTNAQVMISLISAVQALFNSHHLTQRHLFVGCVWSAHLEENNLILVSNEPDQPKYHYELDATSEPVLREGRVLALSVLISGIGSENTTSRECRLSVVKDGLSYHLTNRKDERNVACVSVSPKQLCFGGHSGHPDEMTMILLESLTHRQHF